MSTLNQSQKQGGDKMIWEDMSYNKLDFPFLMQEDNDDYKTEEEDS